MKNENENELDIPDLSGLGEVGTLIIALLIIEVVGRNDCERSG